MNQHLAVIDSHPVQYKAPMYRALANLGVNLKVHYCDRFGVDDRIDPDFKTTLKWDTDLLSGYDNEFMRNRAFRPSPYSPFGEINPGIWSVIKNQDVDVVLINGYSRVSDLIALASARLARKPVIFKGEADNIRPVKGIKKSVKKWLIPRILKQPKTLLYSCTANKEYFQSYGVPEDKLISCPSAVDNQVFQHAHNQLKSHRKKLRDDLGIEQHASVVLFTGRLTDRKRPVDLLKARVLMNSAGPVWNIFVGDGPERENIEQFSRANGIDSVIVTGFVNQSEISSFYTIADVFALPSEYDPSPKSLHEAMNFRLPVVLSDKIGTASDLVASDRNGFVYEFGNQVELAEVLDRCLKSSDVLTKMGDYSLKIVSEWSFEAQAAGIVKALEQATIDRRSE